jgi:hypothetical protein
MKPCIHAKIMPDKAGRIVMRDKAFPCLAPVTEMPVFPNVVTQAYGFHWPPHRNFAHREICEGCPLYVARA